MKKHYVVIMLLFVAGAISAQEKLTKEEKARREKNIEAGNPFMQFGYKAKVATLSKGKYLEVQDLDSIVTIGSIRFHVDRQEIVGFIEPDTINGVYARPIGDVPSRWLSPDPLSEEFSNWSPYNMCFDNPLKFVDPDGRAADDWRNGNGQLVYDTKANGGKGAYTEYATKNDRNLGNALQATSTGKEQFNKLVNSEQPIVVEYNFSSEIVKGTDGGLQLGITTNNYQDGTDLQGNVEEVVLTDSNIKINMATIGEAETQLNSNLEKSVYKNLNFNELVIVTFGHEIEHTTKANILLTAQGGNTETKPTEVGKKIAAEIKENKK